MARMDDDYSDMISEDHAAQANLPQHPVMKDYPKCKYLSQDVPDSMDHLDVNRDEGVDNLTRYRSKTKY